MSEFLPAAASAADVEQFRSEVEALKAESGEETKATYALALSSLGQFGRSRSIINPMIDSSVVEGADFFKAFS